MKNLKCLVFALCLIACSSDDVKSEDIVLSDPEDVELSDPEDLVPSDSEITELESTVLEVNTVASGLVIEANKENSNVSLISEVTEGDIPQVNENISIELPSEVQTAFLGVGLSLEVDSNQEYDGVYLRVKNEEGVKSTIVYKIELNSDQRFSSVNKLKTVGTHGYKSARVNKTKFITNDVVDSDAQKTIDFDFDESIQPGLFCYEICVYVDNGNGGSYVSAPSDVCVQVEAWGGNSELANNWSFKEHKYVEESEFGISEGGFVNNIEYISYVEEYDCNGGLLENPLELRGKTNITKFLLNANGTFVIENEGYYDDNYIYDEIADSYECTDSVIRETYSDVIEGNWAYSETTGLTMVINNNSFDDEEYLFISKGVVTWLGDSIEIKEELEFDYGVEGYEDVVETNYYFLSK